MATTLGILAIAILFRSIYHISARSFYAQQDTKTPLYISLFAVGLNMVLAVWFTFSLNLGVYGLAWATSIAAALEVTILFIVMSKRIKGLFDKVFIHAVARMASATGFMAIIMYTSVALFPLNASDQSFLASFPKFALIVAFNLSAYFFFSYLFKLPEVQPILYRIKKILFYRAR